MLKETALGKRGMIQIKRAYATPSKNDGVRILIDRLWPRGLSKNRARLDAWLKELAPSTELREWFGHDATKWAEFKKKYFQELSHNQDTVDKLKEFAAAHTVTLVYAARDELHNNALALREYIEHATKS